MKIMINVKKQILSAGTIREIIFDNEQECDRWMLNLTGVTKILSKEILEDNKVYIIAIQCYNNIKLFDINLLRGIINDNKK